MQLTSKKCVPCEGGMPRLDPDAVRALMPQLEGWQVEGDDRKLAKRFLFADFLSLIRFVNAMAALAEGEGHHPDFSVRYNVLDVTLWTHAIGGLSENDFILAAKLDALPR